MAYLPPHKRASSSLSISSSPVHRGRNLSDKILYADGCVFRWSPFPPFSSASDDHESLRLETFPCDPIERKIGCKPLVLVSCSREAPSASGEAAAAAIVNRYLPELVAAVERARATTHGVPRDKEELKLSLVARVGKIFFHQGRGGISPVSLDSLRQAVRAGEETPWTQVRKTFYTNVPSECFRHMEQSAVKMMGLNNISSKQHYRVMVTDKHRRDSEISCKCMVQEDGKLVNYKIDLKELRELVEDTSCVFKDLDLRLTLSSKRTMKNLDVEEVDAIEMLISSAVIDPNVKGGLRWPFGKESIGERFSISGVWHTKYEAFMNETLRLKLRLVDRFDHLKSTGTVSKEVSFKLTGISKKLKDGDLEVDTLKEMLEDAVGMIWNSALNYKTTP